MVWYTRYRYGQKEIESRATLRNAPHLPLVEPLGILRLRLPAGHPEVDTRCSSQLAPGSRGYYEPTTRTCARSPPWASRATRRRIECASRRRAPEWSSRASRSTRSPTSSRSPSTRATTNKDTSNTLIPPPRHHRLGRVREDGVPLERQRPDPTFVRFLRT